ncbi:hypothetical protein C1646_704263 [Rhizophagus diaphanus]|nr:hypothetical protein C1646_704263 [Rhizophagus diaphanus] [Rhizophagus sp. MUCL 43196]
MSWEKISVVVGLDFGTTYSGFSYCHTESKNDIVDTKNIRTNDKWPGEVGNLKTNTVLQYDSNFVNVERWGNPALAKQPKSKRANNETRPVELFKLHLGNLQKENRPKLPVELRSEESESHEKAITDYLREIGKLIKETVETRKGVDFKENVLLVLTVPAEYSENDKATMRECARKAGLIDLVGNKKSQKLQFTTEPEAAAIYCMKNKLQQYNLLTIGTMFMIVDCGGGTVDLTTRKLIGIKPFQLGEVTERIGDFCGSTFIDNEFVKFLRRKLGTHAIDRLKENNYGQFQYLIQEFCRRVKEPFTGEDMEFRRELDIEVTAPMLLKYVDEDTREILEDNEWLIEINYEDVISWFDPIIGKINRMINIQLLNTQGTCSAMFLVGGFSESKYLQKRITQDFQHRVQVISVSNQPVAAVVRGATMYGLSLKYSSVAKKLGNRKEYVISTRKLNFTYGIKILSRWKDHHPPNRKVFNDRIYLFETFVKRGKEVEVDEEFISKGYTPLGSTQTALKFELFKTPKKDAIYHDEPGMELVGTLRVPLDANRKVTFGFSFGQMEITAFAKNELGQNVQVRFELSKDSVYL